jgi:hypothetical protein
MNEQETSHYAIQAVLRATTREDFEPKIGRLDSIILVSLSGSIRKL